MTHFGIDHLRKQRDGLTVYDAGLPRFPRNFTRDGIISALLFDDVKMMRDQLLFCALHQGARHDPHTGEEPGKIFHEFPGFPLRGLSTQFNGCDTTGLWLYGLAWCNDMALVAQLRPNIQKAIAYVRSHLREDGLFEEAPNYCGAEQFALKVTYWKDSVLYGRRNGEAEWPAVFTLAHVQTMAGVRAIGTLLGDDSLLEMASRMSNALDLLWDDDLGTFIPMLDAQGPLRLNTSDPLHTLPYLSPNDISSARLAKIAESSQAVETPLGYNVMIPTEAEDVYYDYHAKTVWPFEQAIIHKGARAFGLSKVAQVCERVVPYIQDSAPETLSTFIELNSLSCDPQLWTIAARTYFRREVDVPNVELHKRIDPST